MAMFDDPGKNLRDMETELLLEEFLEEDDGYEPPDYGRTLYEEEEYETDEAVYEEPPKKKGVGCLPLLALLEIGAIYLLVRWWMQWL